MTSSLLVLIVIVLALAGLSRLAPRKSARPTTEVTFPYYVRKTLFSPAERSFLGVLEEAAGDRFRVFGKVRLADTLGVRRGTAKGERQRAVNRLLAKHADYVLCRPSDLSIVALVELDDSSHERPARRARDLFLEKACAAAGLHLLRFPARPTYALSQVRAELAKLDASIDPASAAPAPTTQIGRPGVRP